MKTQYLVRAIAAVAVLGSTCVRQAEYNHPPTVTIAAAPPEIVFSDSVGFSWKGQDEDGNLAGFYCWLDDSCAEVLTESSYVILEGLDMGSHVFFVQAVDDLGARSASEGWQFRVLYDSLVIPRGTDSRLEIATWNIKQFPKADTTVEIVGALMARLDLDIYAVQEIGDTGAFRRLVNGLPHYSGQYSLDDYGDWYIKTGVVYKHDIVRISDVGQLFSGALTRPPMQMKVQASASGRTFDFRLIVLHLKAGGGSEDEEQRRTGCRLLKQYVDRELTRGGEQDFVVVGDWNDRLEDPSEENVFSVILEDSVSYRFLTLDLVGNPRHSSYIGGYLIDHILVTSDALPEYLGGIVQTLRLDDEMTGYQSYVSDHRPVMATFPVFR